MERMNFSDMQLKGQEETKLNRILEAGITKEQICAWTGVKANIVDSLYTSQQRKGIEDGATVLTFLVQMIVSGRARGEDLSLFFDNDSTNLLNKNLTLINDLTRTIYKRVKTIARRDQVICEPGGGSERWAWQLLREARWNEEEVQRLITQVWPWATEFTTVQSKPLNSESIEVYDSRIIGTNDEEETTAVTRSFDEGTETVKMESGEKKKKNIVRVVEEPMPKLQHLHGITGNEARALACLLSFFFEKRDVSLGVKFYRCLMMFNRSYRHTISSVYDANRFESECPRKALKVADFAKSVRTNDFCFASKNIRYSGGCTEQGTASTDTSTLSPRVSQLRQESAFLDSLIQADSMLINSAPTMCTWHLMFRLAFRGIVPIALLNRINSSGTASGASLSLLHSQHWCGIALKSYTAFAVAFGNADLVHFVAKTLHSAFPDGMGPSMAEDFARGCYMTPLAPVKLPDFRKPWDEVEPPPRLDYLLETEKPPRQTVDLQKKYSYILRPEERGLDEYFFQDEEGFQSLMEFTQIPLNGCYRGLAYLFTKCPMTISFLHIGVFSACPRVIDVLLKNSGVLFGDSCCVVGEEEEKVSSTPGSTSSTTWSTSVSKMVNQTSPFCWNPPLRIDNAHEDTPIDVLLYTLVEGVHPQLECYMCKQLIEAQVDAVTIATTLPLPMKEDLEDTNGVNDLSSTISIRKQREVFSGIVLGTNSGAREPFAYLNKTIANQKIHLTKTLLTLGRKLGIVKEMLEAPDEASEFPVLALTPLVLATKLRNESHSLEVVRLLVSFGADINHRFSRIGPRVLPPGFGITCLEVACGAGKSLTYIKALVEELGADFGRGFRTRTLSKKGGESEELEVNEKKDDIIDVRASYGDSRVPKKTEEDPEHISSVHPLFVALGSPELLKYFAERDSVYFIEARNDMDLSALESFALFRGHDVAEGAKAREAARTRSFSYCLDHPGFPEEMKFQTVKTIFRRAILPLIELLLLSEEDGQTATPRTSSSSSTTFSGGGWGKKTTTVSENSFGAKQHTQTQEKKKERRKWGGNFEVDLFRVDERGDHILNNVIDLDVLNLLLQSPIYREDCLELIKSPDHPIFESSDPMLCSRTPPEVAEMLLRSGFPVNHEVNVPVSDGGTLMLSALSAYLVFEDPKNGNGLADILVNYGADIHATVNHRHKETGEFKNMGILDINEMRNGGSTVVADKLRKLAERYSAAQKEEGEKGGGGFSFNF